MAFRIGESPEQFKGRVAEIAGLKKRIADGKADALDVEKLAQLWGTDEAND